MKYRQLIAWTILLSVLLFLLCDFQIKADDMDELTYINKYYNSNLDHQFIYEDGLLDPILGGLSLSLKRNIQGKIWLTSDDSLYLFNDPMFTLDLEWYISNLQYFNLHLNLGLGLARLSDYSENAEIQISISDIRATTESISSDYIIQTLKGKLIDAKKQVYSISKAKLENQIDYIPTSYHWSYQLGMNININNWENQLTIQYIQGLYSQNSSNNTTLQFICHYTSLISPIVSSICKSRSVTFPSFWTENTIFIQKAPIINRNLLYIQFNTIYNVNLLSMTYGNVQLYLGGSLGLLKAVGEAASLPNKPWIEDILYTYAPNLGLLLINDFMTFKLGLNLIEISLHTKI